MKTIKLNNGVEMPMLGYGVFQVEPDECQRCVEDALKSGYRLIDTAQAYMNEEGVGKAMKNSGVKREDIFLVTKIWITNFGYEKAKASIEESLRKLQTSYIDLMLLHQPFNDYYGAYRAMEEAYKEGKIRAIGVSNFPSDRLIDLAHNVEVKPMVNQVEAHVFCQQIKAAKYMNELDCKVMAWGPFAEGKNNLFTDEVLAKIGAKYNKTNAQVALRYLLQRDMIVIPKTTHIERMEQNMNVFDFELTKEDMDEILKMDTGHSVVIGSHQDPEVTKWFMTLLK